MAKYNSVPELIRATDDEINAFFSSATLRGTFDRNIPDNHKTDFCGQITDITINGIKNNLCPKSLYVPTKFSSFVREGNCEFKCVVDLRQLRGYTHRYKLLIINVKGVTIKNDKKLVEQEVLLFKKNLKLNDRLLIGQFTQNKDGSFTIRDVRRSDFSRLVINGKELTPIVYHSKRVKPESGHYYEFAWIPNGAKVEEFQYNFKVDETRSFNEVSPKDLIKRIHDQIEAYPAGAGQKLVKTLETLRNQLTASGKEIFIYELLQNANDYPQINNGKKEKVDVEFHLTKDSLIFMHSGAKFNEKNVAAICDINDKEKTDNKDTIGYKGIGFKTVFLDNNYVYLQTGGFSFRFDKNETKYIVDTPWQILPIWTRYNELKPSEKYVFTTADDKFRVKFVLRPNEEKTLRGPGQNYEQMFRNIFQTERVILFIPHLASVKVFLSSSPIPEIECHTENDHWQVDSFIDKVPEEVTKSINSFLEKQESNQSLKIPTKYLDFKQTKVSFACEIDGSKLQSVKDTQIYCYLPTKASWGFDFLMNTDMIPNGPRDDIEIDFDDQININAEISEIAGRKFFEWIKKLCKNKKYEVNTIYSLIPAFETCIEHNRKYKMLIQRFQNGFESLLKTKPFIIINEEEFVPLNNIIIDDTGLSSSGIMNDKEFCKFVGMDGFSLPHPALRTDESFKSFILRYAEKNQRFKKENLKSKIDNDDFQKWLKNQDNNNKFLNFLLKNGNLKYFSDKKIFLNSRGDLFKADQISYDVDEHLDDLRPFDDRLDYLSPATRKFFESNKEWEKAISEIYFKIFECQTFVDEIMSEQNKIDTINRLRTKDTSIRFFNFLAKNSLSNEGGLYSDLPFFNDSDNVVEGFTAERIVFTTSLTTSQEAHETCKARWLKNVDIEFISPVYSKETINYLRNTINLVDDFSHKFVIEHIILQQDNDTVNYHNKIAEAIELPENDISVSKEFVLYCFAHKSYFKESKQLDNYALSVYDGNGTPHWRIAETNYLFFQSDLYDTYSSKEWINANWMYSINEEYYNDVDERDELIKFLKKAFDVWTLNNRIFCNIVQKQLNVIFDDISSKNDSDGHKSFDFIQFLDKNYNIIFNDPNNPKAAENFKKLKVFEVEHEDGLHDIELEKELSYLYDETLVNITKQSWFPSDIIKVCNRTYGQSKALIKLGVKTFKFSNFFDEVIVKNLEKINLQIKTKESSIAFHNLIIAHEEELLKNQKEKMSGAKLYLYNQKEPADTNCKPKTLSPAASELLQMKLVEFSDIDIIDPDYKTEKNSGYWKILGYDKYTVTDFFKWLSTNSDTFCETIRDKELNIKFWRWVKKNASSDTIESLPFLPVLLKDGSIDETDDPIYLSDEYITGIGIESLIGDLVGNTQKAKYISPKYIEDGDSIDSWKTFWEQNGIKHEMIDILIRSVIPELSIMKNENLPKILSEHRDALKKHYKDDLISKLSALNVKTKDGAFRAIKEAILIDTKEKEPFTYIDLPNQLCYTTNDEFRLFDDILRSVADNNRVTSLNSWQQFKLDSYLAMQDEDVELVRNIHFQFINDLAKLKENNLNNVNRILLLDRNNVFSDASSLTMGSKYQPTFDFDSQNVSSLNYVSNEYQEKCSAVFKLLKMHCDFVVGDEKYLEQRSCAIYFWTKYLPKQEQRIKRINREFISKGLLNELSCIPTKDHMKKPSELYYGEDVSKFASFIEDGDNKFPYNIPLISLDEKTALLSKLPFKKTLDFLDACDALLMVKPKEKADRRKLLEWMIPKYEDKYNTIIEEYRSDKKAVWYNNNNRPIHINELYALNNSAKEAKILEQYFGSNSHIISKKYFPDKLYNKACNLLNIKIIKWSDLNIVPKDDKEDKSYDDDFRIFALTISSVIGGEGWSKLYDGYCKKLDLLSLHRCQSILFTYNGNKDINQSMKQFYWNKDKKEFYYVGNLDGGLVFSDFVNAFLSYVGIGEKEIDGDVVRHIMYNRDNALEKAKEQASMILDETFIKELCKYEPSIKDELGYAPVEQDEIEVINTTSFPQHDGDNTEKQQKDEKAKERKPQNIKPVPKEEKSTDTEGPLHDAGIIERNEPNPKTSTQEDAHPNDNKSSISDSPIKKEEQSSKTRLPNKKSTSNHRQSDFDQIDEIPKISRGDDDVLSKEAQWEAQLEAQQFLMDLIHNWEYPNLYGDCYDNGKPYYFSTAEAKDENGEPVCFVLKSYKDSSQKFKLNPNEWEYMIKEGALLLIYDGNDIKKVNPKELIKDQRKITISFSTNNLDIEDQINKFADSLYYFKELHFDLDSFDLSKKGESFRGIHNKRIGTQPQLTDEDL